MKKIAVIINPKAGSNNKKLLKEVLEKLSDSNQLTIFETSKPGDATEIAKKECSNFDLVAVAGGDGTIHEVINGINEVTPLAIIPTGTANIVAIESGISKNVENICMTINQGKTKKAFIHKINNKKFILMVGVGYDGAVVKNINLTQKKIFGKFIFVVEAIKQFLKLPQFNISIETNNTIYKGNWILITNTKNYAGPFKITKLTNIFDESLVCYVFHKLNKLNFLYNLFLIIVLGDLSKSKNITTLKSSAFKINSKIPIPIQCDGEKLDQFPAIIKTEKQFVNLLVP